MPASRSEQALLALIHNFPGAQQRALGNFIGPDMLSTKSADSAAYTSTVTLTADATPNAPGPELALQLEGSATYHISGLIIITIAAAANNIKFDFNGGNALMSSFVGFTRFGITAVAPLITTIAALNTLSDGSTTNAWTIAEIDVTAEVSTSGSMVMQFAQSVSGATNTVVKRGSYLSAVRVK